MATADDLFQELTSTIDTALGEDNCGTSIAQDVFADLSVWCNQQAVHLAREDAVAANSAYRAIVRSRA